MPVFSVEVAKLSFHKDAFCGSAATPLADQRTALMGHQGIPIPSNSAGSMPNVPVGLVVLTGELLIENAVGKEPHFFSKELCEIQLYNVCADLFAHVRLL